MAQVKVIYDVTACIYKINWDKPVSKWSFQTKLEDQQKDKLVERHLALWSQWTNIIKYNIVASNIWKMADTLISKIFVTRI